MMNERLKEYHEKRNFDRTSEPFGTDPASNDRRLIFVIQKHDSSNLHYDFRLEIDGVLKSWIVPKGLSTDPTVKRLSIRTEDHPLEYADFEGVIPEGEYGAGPVLVWDTGTYRNVSDEDTNKEISMEEALQNGQIKVWLEGKKLRGRYTLIRTENIGDDDNENWLVIKMADEEADARRNPVSTKPESVISGRTLKEIAEQES